MNRAMEGKVALITGASGGIGLATARRFAEAGASVVFSARRANAPMRRTARPEEIAETILWLCSDGASFITGDAIAVDGGQTI